VAETEKPSTNTTDRVLEAAARVLAPLIRLLIAKGVTYQMASELLKQVYVRVAQTRFASDDQVTGTRLSLLTGLNRKEIRRLTSGNAVQAPPMSSYASAVHSVWRTQKPWRDREGQPRPLPRRRLTDRVCFDELVRTVTTDHRPSAVLDELVRLNYVRIDDADNIHLTQGPFPATPDAADRLLRITENLEDHMSAAITNVIEQEPKFLERFAFSDELSAESAEELHQLARQEWDNTYDRVITRAISLEARDKEAQKNTRTRIRVGMYFYSEDSEESKISSDEQST
jgi:Family of unknown function (DUF6502)